MNEDKKIAVLGCGLWGRNVVRNFYNLNALGMVCDLDDDNLAKVQAEYPGVKTTKDFIGNANSLNALGVKGLPLNNLVKAS